jgi:NADPH:quinone reductase-like Zn-dependent oxidoreductase
MRAIRQTRAGSPERLVLSDVPKPFPKPTEILVRIRATSVTRGDVVMRKMPRLFARLVGETPKTIPGNEFAGEVESFGTATTRYEVGERVFGTTTGLKQGAYAEYLSVPEDAFLAHLPSNVGCEEAVPVPIGAMTALHFLEEGGVGSGKRVLINGASGSVGSYAVQIAKHKGAHVTGVSSTSNLELVTSLGADEVIDYTQQNFIEGPQTYDLVFDAAGKTSAKRSARVLGEHGKFVTTQTRRREKVKELIAVRDLLASEAVRAVIDRRYTLDQIPEAHRYVEEGHKRGNVVVIVAQS